MATGSGWLQELRRPFADVEAELLSGCNEVVGREAGGPIPVQLREEALAICWQPAACGPCRLHLQSPICFPAASRMPQTPLSQRCPTIASRENSTDEPPRPSAGERTAPVVPTEGTGGCAASAASTCMMGWSLQLLLPIAASSHSAGLITVSDTSRF